MVTISALAGKPAPGEMLADLARLEREYFGRKPDAPIGGLKVVVARNGWFAARPSGTENIYKIYAESFESQAHLDRILIEAQAMVDAMFGSAA